MPKQQTRSVKVLCSCHQSLFKIEVAKAASEHIHFFSQDAIVKDETKRNGKGYFCPKCNALVAREDPKGKAVKLIIAHVFTQS